MTTRKTVLTLMVSLTIGVSAVSSAVPVGIEIEPSGSTYSDIRSTNASVSIGCAGTLSATKLDVYGRVAVNGTNVSNIGPGIPIPWSSLKNSGRMLIGWNRSGGEGEAAFITNRGDGTNNGNGGGFRFYDYSNTDVEKLLLRLEGGTGNVGIGTATPLEKLHIVGNSRFEGGQLRFYTRTGDATGSTGIVGNPNGWTRLDPGSSANSRFIITVSAADVASNKNILDVERTDTWAHQIELRADGGALFMGKVGIGMAASTSQLSVNGKISAKEIQVMATPADFVFETGYKLKPLNEVESFIKKNKHLPEVPSGKIVEKEGYNVGAMQSKLLQKVEELTLYVIDQDKRLQALVRENVELKSLVRRD